MENGTTITIDCNDVIVRMSCNHSPFIAHVREHIRPLVLDDSDKKPHINININWQEAEKQFPLLAKAEEKGAHKIGKRLFRVKDGLLWTDITRRKYFVLLLSLDGETLNVNYDHYFELPARKLEKNPDYRTKKYFSLLKYFFYLPLIWYNEHFRQRYLLHASGVSLDGRGVALGGVGGVGKTTTCVGLLTQENSRLLSENLIFYDDSNYYQLYEPIRLDDYSVSILGDQQSVISPAEFPGGTRPKQLFHINPDCRMDSIPASVMILPEFAPAGGSAALSAATAANLLENYNMLTREVNDYYWFAGTFNLLRPEISPLREGFRAMEKLLEKVPAYHLYVDRSAGVAPVVETIDQLAKGVE